MERVSNLFHRDLIEAYLDWPFFQRREDQKDAGKRLANDWTILRLLA